MLFCNEFTLASLIFNSSKCFLFIFDFLKWDVNIPCKIMSYVVSTLRYNEFTLGPMTQATLVIFNQKIYLYSYSPSSLYVYLSIYLLIHLFTYLTIYLSIYSPTHLLKYLLTYLHRSSWTWQLFACIFTKNFLVKKFEW